MKVLTVLFCSLVVFGQTAVPRDPKTDTAADAPNQKSQSNFGLGSGAHGRSVSGVEILSDTQGTDFGPYVKGVVKKIRANWLNLIPQSAENKKGKLAIEFAITKDGTVADMRLVASSGAVNLDRPAWGGITKSNPFPPLPSDFKGSFLALRVRYYYNPD